MYICMYVLSYTHKYLAINEGLSVPPISYM